MRDPLVRVVLALVAAAAASAAAVAAQGDKTQTVNDLYSFDPAAVVTLDPFIDIIGRHFKQPKEGLGNDNSPSAHMWRTIANPDNPL